MGFIIGVDEVGRGCLAGEVVVAAVCVPCDTIPVTGVRDSKKLTAKKREALAKAIQEAKSPIYSVIRRNSVAEIDRVGINQATKECFLSSIHELFYLPGIEISEIVVDGNPLWDLDLFPVKTQFIPKADDTVWAVGAASILAKVYRDAMMVELAKEYPYYLWEKNKGYGTSAHIQALEKYGATPEHRKKFTDSALRNARAKKRPVTPEADCWADFLNF